MKILLIAICFLFPLTVQAGKLTNAAVIGGTGYLIGASGNGQGGGVSNPNMVLGYPISCYLSNGVCYTTTSRDIEKTPKESCAAQGLRLKGFIPMGEHEVILVCYLN